MHPLRSSWSPSPGDGTAPAIADRRDAVLQRVLGDLRSFRRNPGPELSYRAPTRRSNAPAVVPTCARPPRRAGAPGRSGRRGQMRTRRFPHPSRRWPPGTSDPRALPSDPTFPLGAVRPDRRHGRPEHRYPRGCWVARRSRRVKTADDQYRPGTAPTGVRVGHAAPTGWLCQHSIGGRLAAGVRSESQLYRRRSCSDNCAATMPAVVATISSSLCPSPTIPLGYRVR